MVQDVSTKGTSWMSIAALSGRRASERSRDLVFAFDFGMVDFLRMGRLLSGLKINGTHETPFTEPAGCRQRRFRVSVDNRTSLPRRA